MDPSLSVSRPHFYQADRHYREAVSLLTHSQPSQSYFLVEQKTSIPTEVVNMSACHSPVTSHSSHMYNMAGLSVKIVSLRQNYCQQTNKWLLQ